MIDPNKKSVKTSMIVSIVSVLTGMAIGGSLQQIEQKKQQPPKNKHSLNKFQKYKKRFLLKGERRYTAYVILRKEIKQSAIKNARKAKEQPSLNR